MKYHECDTKLFVVLDKIGPYSGLSKKIICILGAQRAVKLLEIKFGGQKKRR